MSTATKAEAGMVLMLWGDSHAGQHLPALRPVAERTNVNLLHISATRSRTHQRVFVDSFCFQT